MGTFRKSRVCGHSSNRGPLRDCWFDTRKLSNIVRARPLRRLLRPLLITSCGTVFAGATVWSVAGMVAVSSSIAVGSGHFLPKPQFYSARLAQARVPDEQAGADKRSRLAVGAQPVIVASIAAGAAKAARHPDVAVSANPDGTAARFDAIVKQAALTPEKLAGLFSHSSPARPQRRIAKNDAPPAPERFASLPAVTTVQPHMMLAYADPNPGGAAGAALSALLTPPLEEGLAASQDADEADGEMTAVPNFEDTPSDAPLPRLRPGGEVAAGSDRETEKPDARQAEEQSAPKANERQTQKPQQQLAYARPDYPPERSTGRSLGQTLRNLFGGGTKAGNGVAVYDISAAKVYMPDGSVLEAHSGVGKMADDPRYVNVKMNGPTPPHTYNLKMRESRFHGVEAIRMLPADGKNKYGRDGFLTHSYLLRGRPAESHGCVAFKEYDRFLKAFKQGKVKQIIVVPNGGRSTMLASNGKNSI